MEKLFMQMSGFQLGHPFHFFYKGNELLYWSCSYQNFKKPNFDKVTCNF